MTVGALIEGLPGCEVRGDAGAEVSGFAWDTRDLERGQLFAALPGQRVDGHAYLDAAVAAGAAALLVRRGAVDAEGRPVERDGWAVPLVVVDEVRPALAHLSGALHGRPWERLAMVGITGTNGKTTVAHMTAAILEAAGRVPGVIGTVGHHVGSMRWPAAYTTPEAPELHGLLAAMEEAGADCVAMEVSSHGLELGRTAEMEFDTGVFTHLTRDHLDFHRDETSYREAKWRLFDSLGAAGRSKAPGRAVIGVQDETGRLFASRLEGADPWRFALSDDGAEPVEGVEITADSLETGPEWSRFYLRTPVGESAVELTVPGRLNVLNALAAAGAALRTGASVEEVRRGLAEFRGVPGRLERVDEGEPYRVYVDYAHTPDALERVLESLRDVTRGSLRVVFGCGGDRDRGKRPMMAAVATRLADVAYLTSDNPRSEDPEAILDEVQAGVEPGSEWLRNADRRVSIENAIADARPGDVVLIAGKGHEDYQILPTGRVRFDDRETAREAIAARSRGARA
jgi:UDP-N-acetylmuramoyl-L-alanyl-D-glutamate--2,6-diaminopimelate ligase